MVQWTPERKRCLELAPKALPKTVWAHIQAGNHKVVLHNTFTASKVPFALRARLRCAFWSNCGVQFWQNVEAPRPRLGGGFLMDGWTDGRTDGWQNFDSPSSTFPTWLMPATPAQAPAAPELEDETRRLSKYRLWTIQRRLERLNISCFHLQKAPKRHSAWFHYFQNIFLFEWVSQNFTQSHNFNFHFFVTANYQYSTPVIIPSIASNSQNPGFTLGSRIRKLCRFHTWRSFEVNRFTNLKLISKRILLLFDKTWTAKSGKPTNFNFP